MIKMTNTLMLFLSAAASLATTETTLILLSFLINSLNLLPLLNIMLGILLLIVVSVNVSVAIL